MLRIFKDILDHSTLSNNLLYYSPKTRQPDSLFGTKKHTKGGKSKRWSLQITYFQWTIWGENNLWISVSHEQIFNGCAFISRLITFYTCLNPCSLYYHEKMRPLSTNNSLQWFDRSLYHSRALFTLLSYLSFYGRRVTANNEKSFVNNNRGAQRTAVEGDSLITSPPRWVRVRSDQKRSHCQRSLPTVSFSFSFSFSPLRHVFLFCFCLIWCNEGESSLYFLEVLTTGLRNDESSTKLLLALWPGTGLSALVDLALSLVYACSKCAFECAPRSRKDGSARLVRLRVNYSNLLFGLSLSF